MINSFLLASNNKDKLREISEIFRGQNIEIICPEQAGITLDVEENGLTFEQNAFIKAREACRLSGLASIGDDSGLCVDALCGRPGIYSARYAPTNPQRIEKLLSELNGVPLENRTAKFVCAIACVFPDGREFCAVGDCRGIITDSPRGQNGFGYDPVFFFEEYGKTFSELSADIKNKISHRAHALRSFHEKIMLMNK